MTNILGNSKICSSFLVIDLSKIPTADLQNWNKKNSNYFTAGAPTGMQYINATLISTSEFASWLYDNQNYLSYSSSYEYIECAHLITDPNTISIVNRSPEVCQLSFTTIISKIEAAGGDFNNPSYLKYAKMVCQDNKVSVSMITQFDSQANCYSIPFLHSVLNRNPTLSLSSLVTFKTCMFPTESYEKVILSVNLGTNIIKSYDFSQTPP